jgi:hypothetical protein
MDTVSIHLLFDVGNEVVPGIDYGGAWQPYWLPHPPVSPF